MPGNRAAKSAIDRASSQAPPAAIGRGHRPGHDVARRELAAGIGVEHEAPPLAIDQQRARPAYRLGDERRRIHPGKLERGRVELQKLDVAKLGAGPVCQRPAVGGRHPRIGGDGVQLADAARGEHHGARGMDARCAAGAQRHHAGDPPLVHQEAVTSVCSSSSISGCRRTTCARQPISAAPVRSPPAWMIRGRVCAASSPKRSRPSGPRSKRAPRASSS